MALFNAIIRPVLLALVAPRSLILIGVLVLVLQVVAFLIVAPSWRPASRSTASSRRSSARSSTRSINTVLTAVLGVDRGGSFFGLLCPEPAGRSGAAATTDAGPRDHPDRRLAHPILAARVRAGSVNTMAGWIRDGTPQAVALGGAPALDDLGQPGRHPPRQQRRHPGLPLVRAGPPEADGLEQSRTTPRRSSAACRTARACSRTMASASATWSRATRRAPTSRRPRSRTGAGPRRQPGVPQLLLQPERLPALVHDVPRRVRQGADSRRAGRGGPGSRPRCTAA